MINWVFPWSLNTFAKAPAVRSSEKKGRRKERNMPPKKNERNVTPNPNTKEAIYKTPSQTQNCPCGNNAQVQKEDEKKAKK